MTPTQIALLAVRIVGRVFVLFIVWVLLVQRTSELAASIGVTLLGLVWVARAVAKQLRQPSPGDMTSSDEGGIRWQRRGARGYVPMEDIFEVRAIGSRDVPTILLKENRRTHRLPTGGFDTALILNDVRVFRLCWRADAARPELARQGRPLDAWLAALRAAHGIGEASYRSNVRPDASLAIHARNRHAKVGERAGAAYVVFASRDDEAIAKLLETFRELTPPPIVIAAALGAPDRVDAQLLERALAIVAPEEADAARALMVEPTHTRIAENVRLEAREPDTEEALEQPGERAAAMRR